MVFPWFFTNFTPVGIQGDLKHPRGSTHGPCNFVLMTLDYFRTYCLSKPGTSEDTPFGPDTLCLRVGGKIFALTDLEEFAYINLKCDPERAVELREQYEGITPGYHMNKKLWNSVSVLGNVPEKLILELADHSYDLILQSLPKKIQAEIRP